MAWLCLILAGLLEIGWPIGLKMADNPDTRISGIVIAIIFMLGIGLIVGFVAHKLFHLSKEHSAKYVTVATVVSSICGMAFNIVADPVVGYFYKTYLLGVPQNLAKTLAKIGAITTSVNAVIAVIVASIIYLALRPAMKKLNMLRDL